jgi:lysozyme
VILGGVAALAAWWFPRYEPNRVRYPLRGLDVSHHQGPIDWAAAANDDVAFVYIKATEGQTIRDAAFAQNWREARDAGLRVGAYHYFTLCRPGRDQALNFLAAVPKRADALPPAVDLEFGGNCSDRPDPAAFRRELDAFLGPVEARDGKPAVLYVTAEFLKAYGQVLPKRQLWRRSILLTPAFGQDWTFWQYHNRGHVAGITGPVDLNVFAGGRRAFTRFVAARRTEVAGF